jgi:hypothetical protein
MIMEGILYGLGWGPLFAHGARVLGTPPGAIEGAVVPPDIAHGAVVPPPDGGTGVAVVHGALMG